MGRTELEWSQARGKGLMGDISTRLGWSVREAGSNPNFGSEEIRHTVMLVRRKAPTRAGLCSRHIWK